MARSSRRSAVLILSIVLACGCLGMVFGQRLTSSASSSNSDNDVRDSLKTFSDVYRVVQENYAEPVSPDKSIYNGAIPGMLRVLDPHSNFFDPKSYAALREEQRGKYYGVGMQVGPRNNKVIVIAPFAGAPAYRAGIRPTLDYQPATRPRLTKHQFLAAANRTVGYAVTGYVSSLIARQPEHAVAVGLKVGLAIGVVTAIAGSCTPFVEWTADHVPARSMGVFGVGLILIGFTLQSVQYWATLLDVSAR